MGYLNCPGCARRLRVPDSLSPMELQCPACRHTFRSDGVALEGQTPGAVADAPASADPPGADVPLLGPDAAAGRILSKADESMLRDYGSGSGLLELTREAISLSAGEAASPPSGPPQAGAGQSPHDLDRQFQIVGTALTLANTLVLAHKTELARSRRGAALGWALVAAMTLAAGSAGWWAVRQSGLTELERANVNLERVNVANLSGRLLDANARLAEHNLREPKLAEELSAARNDYRAAQAELNNARNQERAIQAELAAAKESLGEKKGAAEALAAKLEAAEARATALAADVQRLQAELATARAVGGRSTTQPTSAPEGTASAGK